MVQNFTYQIPNRVHFFTKYPIKNEKGKTIFLLKKRPHKFLASIFNAILRFGLPYTYKITYSNGNPLYSVDCWFPGMRYKVIDHISSEIVPVTQHRVQLIEKAYSFIFSSQAYYFEKDYTGTGHLKCDNTEIATISMPSPLNISMSYTINIVAETEEMAALTAVLFHTFYHDIM